MKKLTFLLIILFSVIISQAQTLPGINYQALLRNSNGQTITNQPISMEAYILHGLDSVEVYKETHNTTTNAFGQVNLTIGEGNVIFGSFNAINWGNGLYFLKTAVDLNQSGTFHELEVVKFYSVPYSNYANVAGSIPVMTSADREMIENPVAGMQIFNSNRFCIEYFDGLNWASSIPAGTVQPFAGEYSVVPQGWLPCDGSEYQKTDFPDLYEAIKNAWGENGTKFRVPDLRGQFLRGVDGTSGVDPNKTIRTAKYTGGNTGNNVGSFQGDAFQGHSHLVYTGGNVTTGQNMTSQSASLSGSGIGIMVSSYAGPYAYGTAIYNLSGYGNANFTSESRAKNAYVNYIIKF